jgi:hypothetical protein
MVLLNTFSITTEVFSLHTKISISSDAPNRKCQRTVTLTGPSRVVDPWYGTCFFSPFWHLEFGGASQILGKFTGLLTYAMIWSHTCSLIRTGLNRVSCVIKIEKMMTFGKKYKFYFRLILSVPRFCS